MNSRSCTVLAFANQKGGVGKTTSAVNLAASLGMLGKKVLLVDFDPQGNATSGVGIEKNGDNSAYDLLMGANPYACIAKTAFENLDVLPSDISLAGAELELVDEKDRQYKLKHALDSLRNDYDYMLIDGEKYQPTNTEGNSTFEIPVTGFDWRMPVIADTIAMSQPHEIEYTLTFDASSAEVNG